MNEPAVECLAGCDDFARKQNLLPACHVPACPARSRSLPLSTPTASDSQTPSGPALPLPREELRV